MIGLRQIVLVALIHTTAVSASSGSHNDQCKDRVPNCVIYSQGVCTSINWRSWAQVNCKHFCGFCSASAPDVSNATVPPHDRTTKAMVTIPPKDITCAICSGPPEACELAYYETTCHPPNHYCINHVTTKTSGQRLVERRCGNIHDCYNDWYLGTSDDDKCRQLSSTNILTYNFECSYCCIKDRCNVDLHPKRDTLYMNV